MNTFVVGMYSSVDYLNCHKWWKFPPQTSQEWGFSPIIFLMCVTKWLFDLTVFQHTINTWIFSFAQDFADQWLYATRSCTCIHNYTRSNVNSESVLLLNTCSLSLSDPRARLIIVSSGNFRCYFEMISYHPNDCLYYPVVITNKPFIVI